MAAILGPLFSDKKLNFEQYLLNTHWHYTLQIHGITLAPIHVHNINSLAFFLSLPLWLYKDSGSRNTIYASLASYIMRVLAPIHAHNINSLAFSLSLPLWLYKDSGSRNTTYASLASYIMQVLTPIHAHNINSLAFYLSLSLNGFIRIPAHGTLYMPA